jgi:putative transposase
VQAGISAGQQQALTDSALRGWALGGPEFVENLKKKTTRRVSKGLAGRPLSKQIDTKK